MKSVAELKLEGKKVLVRCDFNVPLEHQRIADTARIDASLDTIRYVLSHDGAAVLCSHLGRPKGRSPELSLAPVAEYLGKALGQRVLLTRDCIGDLALRMVHDLPRGEVLLLENLRFHAEEEVNDQDFASQLAFGKNIYVNDAFGTAHRAHASTVGVVPFLREHAAGFLMLREVHALRAVTEKPAHPYVAILGGVKVSDKINVVRAFLTKADTILVGGAMAYTFLAAGGEDVGSSLVESDKLDLAKELLAEAERRKVALVLPIDHVVASSRENGSDAQTVKHIPKGMMGLDIGPLTISNFGARLAGARTVIWNGPLGYFERPSFRQGTLMVGQIVSQLDGVFSVIAGGDTGAALDGYSWSKKFSHISTGGGATLEFLEGRELPGIKALET
jgi:phosphoglycerate kinase